MERASGEVCANKRIGVHVDFTQEVLLSLVIDKLRYQFLGLAEVYAVILVVGKEHEAVLP